MNVNVLHKGAAHFPPIRPTPAVRGLCKLGGRLRIPALVGAEKLPISVGTVPEAPEPSTGRDHGELSLDHRPR